MAERLTMTYFDDVTTYDPIDVQNNEYSEINFKKVLKKLAHYEDLEEAGRLIELPCKEIYTSIGDMVYYIYYDEVIECVNCGVQIGCDGKVYIGLACDISDIVDDYADEWGKTIFLTKEEAEAKLKERGEQE